MRIRLDKSWIAGRAEEIFLQICRFDLDNDRDRRMMDDAVRVRDRIVREDGEELVRAVYSFVPEDRIRRVCGREGEVMEFCVVPIRCGVFRQIEPGDVRGAVFYALTAGPSWNQEGGRITEAFYADSWGTAFVEAGKEALREAIRERIANCSGPEKLLSRELGPGYYGMAIGETHSFFRILGGTERDRSLCLPDAGIRLTESGIMLPEKSSMGMSFLTEGQLIELAAACASCVGNPGGCGFCEYRRR